MRLLHISDLHANLAFYQWLVAESFKYDLVCLNGDLLNLGDFDSVPMELSASVQTPA
jgi:predicted phosphodiesterase